jgi:hypothetical protein
MARIDFPAISDRGPRPADTSSREPQPGDTWDETVYEDTGGDWRNGEWGDEIGKVTLKQSRTSDRGNVVEASFTFTDTDTVELSGAVPGNGTWRGKGSLRIVKGTGKFADRKGRDVTVDSTNPKRWG